MCLLPPPPHLQSPHGAHLGMNVSSVCRRQGRRRLLWVCVYWMRESRPAGLSQQLHVLGGVRNVLYVFWNMWKHCRGQKWRRTRPSSSCGFVPTWSCPHQTHHVSEGVFSSAWSGPCGDIFTPICLIFSLQQSLCFSHPLFTCLDLVSICISPAAHELWSRSRITWKPHMALMSIILMQHLSHPPTHSSHPFFTRFPIFFIKDHSWFQEYLCKEILFCGGTQIDVKC